MEKTHWKKLKNNNYIGAYTLEPGCDLILTIKAVVKDNIVGEDGKKEQGTLLYFNEIDKPMVLNSTNAKTIVAIYGTPYVEEWVGKKIQLYATKVKAFGEMVEALRIRKFVPKQAPPNGKSKEKCVDCGKEIEGYGKYTAEQMAVYTNQKYGKTICAECAKKYKAIQSEDNKLENLMEDINNIGGSNE